MAAHTLDTNSEAGRVGRRLKIGQRLMLAFGVLMLLMFLGSLVGLWQVETMRQEALGVYQAGEQAVTLAEVYSQVLSYMDGDSISKTVRHLVEGGREQIIKEQVLALAEIKSAERWALTSVLVSVLLTLLAALILSLVVTRSVTRPLAGLGQAARSLARGEFSYRLPQEGRDELAELSRSFNNTAARLQRLYREIEEREALYRTIMDHTQAVIYLKDVQGRYLLVNQRFQELFLVSPQEVEGKTDTDIFPRDVALSFRANDQKVLESGQAMELEELAPHNGEMHNYISVKVPLPGPDGKPFAVCGISTDITDRQRAEQAIRESEAKYRLLADNVTDVIWVLELSTMRFSYISPSVLSQRGYTAEEAMVQSLDQVLTPASLQQTYDLLAEEMQRDADGDADPHRTRTLELENLCRDGSFIWTEATCSFMRDETGHATAIIGVSRDITQRREAQEQLRQSEEKHRLILEATPEPVVLYDMEGRALYVNPAFTRVFGWTLEELSGKQVDYVPPEEWPETRKHVEATRRGEPISGWETRRRDKQGNILEISLSSAIWRDQDGNPVGSIIVLQDITKRKKMDSQLERARKMEAIGNLTGGIAHDFNNVLQAVSGNVQLLMLKPELGQAVLDRLADVDNLVGRAAEMVQQLLAFSRKQAEKLEPVSVNHAMRQVCSLLERIIPRMIHLELDLAEDLMPVRGNQAQLERIILNLATNAVDAMPDGGRLILQTENLVLDEIFCRTHPELVPGPHILLKVTDTGRGMDQTTLAQIFDPFFTTKPPGKGTGLGLSTVYGIVGNHGGLVTCYSTPGQGTVFNIYLPALPEPLPAEALPPEVASVPDGGGETVLIVDDEPSILSSGAEILAMHGYRVLTAQSGEEALRVYQERTNRVGLVIMDLGMPGMGGQRCLERLLEIDPTASVVISSGYANENTVRELKASGAAGFITKPYRLSDMVARVRSILYAEEKA